MRMRDNVGVRDMSVDEWGKKSGLRETEGVGEVWGEKEWVLERRAGRNRRLLVYDNSGWV